MPISLSSRPAPLATAAVPVLLLAMLLGACTGAPESAPSPAPSSAQPPSPRVTGARPTLEAKPVPFEVSIARVVGERIKAPQRRALRRKVGRVVRGYVEQAFLAGAYPRTGFYPALSSFTDGARKQAWQDRDLLTNAAVAQNVERVVPRRTSARLFPLVPNKTVAGVTARVRVVFTQEMVRGKDQRVVVSGRLILARNRNNAWQIFGYDLQREGGRS